MMKTMTTRWKRDCDDVTHAMLKGDGLQRAAVNCPCTFRLSVLV